MQNLFQPLYVPLPFSNSVLHVYTISCSHSHYIWPLIKVNRYKIGQWPMHARQSSIRIQSYNWKVISLIAVMVVLANNKVLPHRWLKDLAVFLQFFSVTMAGHYVVLITSNTRRWIVSENCQSWPLPIRERVQLNPIRDNQFLLPLQLCPRLSAYEVMLHVLGSMCHLPRPFPLISVHQSA